MRQSFFFLVLFLLANGSVFSQNSVSLKPDTGKGVTISRHIYYSWSLVLWANAVFPMIGIGKATTGPAKIWDL